MPRTAVALNLAKAWLFVVVLATAFGAHRLAHRRPPQRRALRVLLAPRRAGRLPLRRPGAPRDARRTSLRTGGGPDPPLDGRHRGGTARHPAAGYPADRRRLPSALRRRTRPAKLDAGHLDRSAEGAPPRGARGRDRARARARPPPRRPRADVRRPLRGDARGDQPYRRLALARAPLRLRPGRRGIRAPAPLGPSASSTPTRSRPRRPEAHTISPTRSFASTTHPTSSTSSPRPRPSRSIRSTRSRTPAWRACSRRTPSSTRVCAGSESSARARAETAARRLLSPRSRRAEARREPNRGSARRDDGGGRA